MIRNSRVLKLYIAIALLGLNVLLVGPLAQADDTTTIMAARAANDGTAVTVQGTVTVATKVFDEEGRSFYLQDSTGGINIFYSKGGLPTLVDGDTVQLSGKLATFAKHREITLASLDVLKKVNTDAPKPLVPVTIHTGDGTAHAGQLVRMQGGIIAGSADFFVITDNTDINQGNVNVYLYNTANIGFNVVAANQPVCVTGIVDPYNNALEILPRNPADLQTGNCPAA